MLAPLTLFPSMQLVPTQRLVRCAAIACAFALLAGCRSGDAFCAAHNAADLTPSRAAYERMSPFERRAAEARLQEAAKRCGWEP